jgi:hypothetical protein
MQDGWRKGLELDRIENDKGYYKGNCRWNTEAGQQRNKTNTKLNEVKVGDIRTSTLTTKELAYKYNVHTSTINRVKANKRWNLSL